MVLRDDPDPLARCVRRVQRLSLDYGTDVWESARVQCEYRLCYFRGER